MGERLEMLMRIPVAIVSGIIIGVWALLIRFLVLIQIIIVLFSGNRNKSLAELCEIWNAYTYRFMKYLIFATNERPFPFKDLKPVEPADVSLKPKAKKKKKR